MHIHIQKRTAFILLLSSGFCFLAFMPRVAPVKRGLDSYGDPLPPGAVARFGTVRFRHGSGVSHIAFSSDGKKLVFAGLGDLDNAIRLAESSTGKELRTFDLMPGEMPLGLDFAPDGKILAVAAFNYSKPGGAAAVVVWDTTTGKELARIDFGKNPTYVLVFSPNSKVLVTQDYKRLKGNTSQSSMKAWDATTGNLLHEFKDLEGLGSRPAFSPDGKRLAITTSANDFQRGPTKGFIYDTSTWQVAQPMAARQPTHQFRAEILTYSPDGKWLVAGDPYKHIDFMKPETGELIDRIPVPAPGVSAATDVRSLSFSHDSKMLGVATTYNEVAIWWDIAARNKYYKLDGEHSVAVFSPTESLLVTGGGRRWGTYGTTSGGYPGLRFWDPSTGKEILKNDAPSATVELTHWLPDGKLMAVSPAENCYRLWDWGTSKQVAKVSLEGKSLWVAWSAVSQDGRLLAVSQFSGQGNDETIQIFDLAAGEVIHRLESKMVRLPIGFTADGRFLLVGVDPNLIEIWDTSDGKLSRTLDLKKALGKGYASIAAISGDGKKLALQVSVLLVEPHGPDPGFTVWPHGYYRCIIDIATGKELWATKRDDSGQPDIVSSFHFSPDGKILTERVGQTINLRDSTTGALLRTLKCEKEWHQWALHAEALAFTPDSKKLIAADLRNNIYVWDVATGKELQKFNGHRGRIFSIGVSLDGRKFATSSEDSTVLIWQLDAE